MSLELVFLYSLTVYSLFQYLDIYSTKLALSKLNFEKHEVNPIFVSLAKRLGPDKSLVIMWLVIAPSIALLDTFFFVNIAGFPIACFIFGMFHALAAANNFQIYFQTQIVGAQNVERNTNFVIQLLKQRSILGKIHLLAKLNLLSIFLAAYSMTALILFMRLLSSLRVTLVEPVSYLLLYLPPIMIFALIMFFPVNVFGIFVISLRRLKTSASTNEQSDDNDQYVVSLPIDVLETAMENAKKTNAEYIQFCVSQHDFEDHKSA